MLLLLLAALPALGYIQQLHHMQRRTAALASASLEAGIFQLMRKSGQFTRKMEALQELLAQAEGELLYLKSLREPSLILKEVGNDSGELGLTGLEAAGARLARELAILKGLLAVTAQRWLDLRERMDTRRFAALLRALEEVANTRHPRIAQLRLYGKYMDETEWQARLLHRLAPQVAQPVPASISDLPARMREVQTAIRELERALTAFQYR
ncbi:MAG: hypothetical protein O7A08_12420 [SAR324 cluster bacterium]|nr:hypothetical protein [SAR324 cluster bacterium]